jgi:DNA polymerase-4
VTVKIRSASFATATRSETAGYPITDLAELTSVAQRLALAALPDGGVRLIGVSLAGLIDAPPPTLFDADAPPDQETTAREQPTPRPTEPDLPEPAGTATDLTGSPSDPAPSFRWTPADPASGPAVHQPDSEPHQPTRPWRPGDDVHHPEHGHGWVQGAGHGRVTVRFETLSTGPGRAHTLPADDPALTRAEPLDSLN